MPNIKGFETAWKNNKVFNKVACVKVCTVIHEVITKRWCVHIKQAAQKNDFEPERKKALVLKAKTWNRMLMYGYYVKN